MDVFPVVAFLYPKSSFPVEEKRRVRRLKETTAKSYCFKEYGF